MSQLKCSKCGKWLLPQDAKRRAAKWVCFPCWWDSVCQHASEQPTLRDVTDEELAKAGLERKEASE